jgi:ABC-type branched-subunit amino acid transport system substrate-binding protein
VGTSGLSDRLQRALLACVVLSLSVLAAGCGGSSLDPGYALAADAAVQGGPIRATPSGESGADPTGGTPTTSPQENPLTVDSPAIASGPISSLAGSHGSAGATGVHAASGGGRVSCTGFHNQTGITDDAVTLANVADISGPVPGIFTSAELAAKAYVAYFNATSNLCGRKLKMLPLDSRTDAGADEAAYLTACQEAFGAVGSMSAFDSGGAGTAQSCGLPDLRAAAVSDARNDCRTCFGAQATDRHAFQNAVPDFLLSHYAAASEHAAMIYVNAAASVQNARVQQAVEEKRGMRFVYSTSFDVAEFNYSPYVQRMKDSGVRMVQFVGSSDEAVRFARAMQSVSYKPDVFVLDPTSCDPTFVQTGGTAVDGSLIFIDFTPLTEAAHNGELRLYEQWLQQVAPGAVPSYFGLFAWSATRLFVEQAASLGGRLTRAELVDRIRRVRGWTSNGLHAPQDVGGKTNSNCWRFIRLHDGRWSPLGGTSYLCDGETRVD